MTTPIRNFSSVTLILGVTMGWIVLFAPSSQAKTRPELTPRANGHKPSKSSSKSSKSSGSSKSGSSKKSSSKKSSSSSKSDHRRDHGGEHYDDKYHRTHRYYGRSHRRYSYPRSYYRRPFYSGFRYTRPVYTVTPSYSYSSGYSSTQIYRGIPVETDSTTTTNEQRELNRAIQEELKRRGYYRGGIDGIIGPQSLNAIASFRRDHSLSQSQSVDSDLLAALFSR